MKYSALKPENTKFTDGCVKLAMIDLTTSRNLTRCPRLHQYLGLWEYSIHKP